jgi:transcription antitermination protein NusB
MAFSRDIRRCALQAMYQFDAGGDEANIRASLDHSPGDEAAHEMGYDLAVKAWAAHEEADATIAALTPEWPTYRQPLIDRNLLRLAHYEMTHADTPPKVAINEAVELAKEFSTDKSPLFINGVLDRIFKSLKEQGIRQ